MKFFGLVENPDLNNAFMQDQNHSHNIPADSKLRIRNGSANVNKQGTIHESKVFSTVVPFK